MDANDDFVGVEIRGLLRDARRRPAAQTESGASGDTAGLRCHHRKQHETKQEQHEPAVLIHALSIGEVIALSRLAEIVRIVQYGKELYTEK
jgi:hypothetical protein